MHNTHNEERDAAKYRERAEECDFVPRICDRGKECRLDIAVYVRGARVG